MNAPFTRQGGVLRCEGVPLPDLVARWGTPLYVYSRTAIRDRFHQLDTALAPVPHLIAYSVKANPNLAILPHPGRDGRRRRRGERRRAAARASWRGSPASRIVFSGVGKTINELALGLNEEIYAFNVESEGELCALSDLACAMGKTAPVVVVPTPGNSAHRPWGSGHPLRPQPPRSISGPLCL